MKVPTVALRALAKKYKLQLLVLFGSHAQGLARIGSDIDLAFYSLRKINEERLYQDICSLLHREDVDVVNLGRTQNLYTRFEILNSCTLIFESGKGFLSTMRGQSFIDYTDFKRFFDERSKILDRRLAGMV